MSLVHLMDQFKCIMARNCSTIIIHFILQSYKNIKKYINDLDTCSVGDGVYATSREPAAE